MIEKIQTIHVKNGHNEDIEILPGENAEKINELIEKVNQIDKILMEIWAGKTI